MKRLNLPKSLLIAGLSSLIAVSVQADDGVDKAKKYRTFETENGNTVQVLKRGQRDDEGNARGSRRVRVTDADGELVAKGVDRGRKTADGNTARAKKRTWVDEEGNVTQKRARAQKDGQGNARAQRQGRKFDADGNVTARAKDRGRKHADGSWSRRTVKQKQLPNGQRVSKVRTRSGQR